MERRHGMPRFLEAWTIYFQSRGPEQIRERLFNTIWASYYARVLVFVRQMVPPSEAEDRVQEIMIKVFQNLESYNPVYAFSTWIYAIARNHCLNWLKKKRPVTQPADPLLSKDMRLSHMNTPEQILIDREDTEIVEKSLGRMEAGWRQLAFLRYYEGLKIREIASIMRLPGGTVKSRLHTLRKQIQKALEKAHESPKSDSPAL
jgi:RNA polymerase sigma-70 factor (ECF subfamily)